MLQPYAVSAVVQTPNGALEHILYIVQASSIDAAEGGVIAQSLNEGRTLRGLLSKSFIFDDEKTPAKIG